MENRPRKTYVSQVPSLQLRQSERVLRGNSPVCAELASPEKFLDACDKFGPDRGGVTGEKLQGVKVEPEARRKTSVTAFCGPRDAKQARVRQECTQPLSLLPFGCFAS